MPRRIPDVKPEVIVKKKKQEIPSPQYENQPQEQPQQYQQKNQQQDFKKKDTPKINFWEQFKGIELIIQLKSGTIIEGIFEEEKSGFLKIANATVKGKDNMVTVDWVWTERNVVAHFHPRAEVQKKI
ncbi:MAG: hypothetical protein HQK76_01260 [Desulfobacterales bacterium]|nr:hypothetical protein [Desulfobacterales bacterium]